MRKLLDSPSKEIRFLAKYVVNDQRSITARNVLYLQKLINLQVLGFASWKVKQCLKTKNVPTDDIWRTCLLSKLLEARVMST